MKNCIRHNFTEHNQDYELVVRLGGFSNDLICYDAYKRYTLFGFTLFRYDHNALLHSNNIRTVLDAKNTSNWTRDDYITHGMKIWANKTIDGRTTFIKLTKNHE